MVNGALNWLAAFFLAASLAAAQLLLGGWWYPALAAPGYLFAALAAGAAGLAFTGVRDAPGAWCTGSTLLFAGYLFWRQSEAPDPYVARADIWLLLGFLSVYFCVAWQIRARGPRALLLCMVFLLLAGQALLAVAQFAAETPFHPWPELAMHMSLPRGDAAAWRAGWLSGTFASRTALAGALEVSAFLALGLLVWGRGGAAVKLALLWVAAAGFVALSLSLSRSAYLGVPAGVAAFAALSFFIVRRGAVAHRGWLAAGALLLIALSLAFALAAGAESFAVRLRLTELHLDEYRQNLWSITVPPMLSIDPWLGAGANMFDQLSLRYRGGGFSAKPVHAHNDWLQLLVEYGRVGLALGLLFLAVHLAAGWRNALRLAKEMPLRGLLPQGTTLGLAAGSFSAAVALAVHAFFDYGMHIPAVALSAALCGGWLAGARQSLEMRETSALPWWIKALALLPLVPAAALALSVLREGPAEWHALRSENALCAGSPDGAWDEAMLGLVLRPANARLLVLAGESAGRLGDRAVFSAEKKEWYNRASSYFSEAARERPFFAYVWRERSMALDYEGRFGQALPAHLRAIARDPDHARGYEYLGYHFWSTGRNEEAGRLFRLSQTLTGSSLAEDLLKAMDKGRDSL
ncbi:MAG: O-antigen ligase family protein [Chthoniobacterales bacterium]|nr:O-antigen ligase family protein [Chthoniobacterales bacterium]